MSEIKHTPGPWVVGISSDNEIMSVNAPEFGGMEICEVWGEDDDITITPMSTANARLIAAAPELLEALEMLYAVVQGECPSLLDEDSGGDSRLDIAIVAAIAKAKGEQP